MDHAIITPSGEQMACRGKCCSSDGIQMLSRPEQGPLFETPEFDRAIPTCGGQGPFVRTKSQGVRIIRMGLPDTM